MSGSKKGTVPDRTDSPADQAPTEPTPPVRLALSLGALGLKPIFAAQWLSEHAEATPYRVSQVDRGALRLWGEAGQLTVPSPDEDGEESAVGDWVMVQNQSVVATLPRTTWLRRRAISTSRAQIIAANIDVVFVVCAFAKTEKLQIRNLNSRRIVRYLHAVSEGGALPVVVLNKADLVEDTASAVSELSQALNHPHVVATSSVDGDVAALKAWIGPEDTVAFVGPSGVGKSSLINRLVGGQVAQVSGVRDVDNKGRHTTTRRELIALPNGGLLIDTPGMRQFAIYSDEQSRGTAFADLEELASQCRFPDCTHENEPDCAVMAAVSRGQLSAERVGSYQKLQREALRLRSRTDAYSRHLQNKEQKRFTRLVNSIQKRKRH